MSAEFVPVKTKYPGIPPKGEPMWVHLDWIQTTAASLTQWAELVDRRQNWNKQRNAGVDSSDDVMIQHEIQRWRQLWGEVLPLFQETKAILPLEIWSRFKHIRTPHDAERCPAEAVAEWSALRDYALDRLAKGTMPEPDVPGRNAPPAPRPKEFAQALRDFRHHAGCLLSTHIDFEKVAHDARMMVESGSYPPDMQKGFMRWMRIEKRSGETCGAQVKR